VRWREHYEDKYQADANDILMTFLFQYLRLDQRIRSKGFHNGKRSLSEYIFAVPTGAAVDQYSNSSVIISSTCQMKWRFSVLVSRIGTAIVHQEKFHHFMVISSGCRYVERHVPLSVNWVFRSPQQQQLFCYFHKPQSKEKLNNYFIFAYIVSTFNTLRPRPKEFDRFHHVVQSTRQLQECVRPLRANYPVQRSV